MNINRKKIIAGNWKMNKLFKEGLDLASSITNNIESNDRTSESEKPLVILAPPYYLLKHIVDITERTSCIEVAAQNVSYAESGAYTGEISASMLASVGVQWVITGHSERRNIFGEDDQMLSDKASAVIKNKLNLIFCVGEKLDEREAGNHFQTVEQQLRKGLFHFDKKAFEKIVIAYEPVWAIGTGHNASPQQAQEMHEYIRNIVDKQYNTDVASSLTILYGGSCKPGNAKELFAMPDVDGGLIGGASLNSSDFIKIINSI